MCIPEEATIKLDQMVTLIEFVTRIKLVFSMSSSLSKV